MTTIKVTISEKDIKYLRLMKLLHEEGIYFEKRVEDGKPIETGIVVNRGQFTTTNTDKQ